MVDYSNENSVIKFINLICFNLSVHQNTLWLRKIGDSFTTHAQKCQHRQDFINKSVLLFCFYFIQHAKCCFACCALNGMTNTYVARHKSLNKICREFFSSKFETCVLYFQTWQNPF